MSPEERPTREALRRLAKDEAGMTMGLTIVMVVLIGVMGAALLTFVSTDLNAVVEINQGQRAFEMADAGIRAAELQLMSDSTPGHYDGDANEVQWSLGRNGVTLNDLDENSSTSDSTTVTINYVPSADHFVAVSDGRYGGARRRIEATYTATTGALGQGFDGYYTPGDVRIDKGADMDGISVFSGRNILLSDYDWGYYGKTPRSDDRINVNTARQEDPLGDWNIPPWNATQRTDKNNPSRSFEFPGFAAEGFICKSSGCGSASQSIADGWYGYDSTTGSKGSRKKFVRKAAVGGRTQPKKQIYYPFDVDRIAPDDETVQTWIDEAKAQGNGTKPGNGRYIDTRTDSYDNWNAFYGRSEPGTVVFVDGRDNRPIVSVKETAGKAQGVLIGYCIDLTLDAPTDFKGIIAVLKDDTCPDKGSYKSNGAEVQGYVYSQGDNPNSPSISIASKSRILPLPEGFEPNPIVGGGVSREGWREVYR